jgi:hypothetical protein
MMFAFVVFLSAFLLFQVQLIAAKHLLPWFGGTPAVWTTSQMFFQLLLLGGYAYAHLLTNTWGRWRQFQIHLAVLVAAIVALFALPLWGADPLLAPSWLKPEGTESPVLLLLLSLMVSVGLPFFAVSTTGPLLQQWHSRQSASLSRTYRLYALSNAGSFLGLLSYPFGVERVLDLPQQGWLWAALFAVFAIGCGVVAWRAAYSEAPVDAQPRLAEGTPAADDAESRADAHHVGSWLLLTFMSSVMFLATTNQLSQDVAAVPFLWVLPLAIYLLTFIICFDRPEWYSRRWGTVAAAVSSIAILPSVTMGLGVLAQVCGYGAFLFSICMLYHGELVRLRPGPRQLTLFYLIVAFGGALGGTFVSIAAPLWFPDLWEFQAAVVVGWIVIGLVWLADRNSPFYTGDRWLFSATVTLGSWFAIGYLVERTRVGRVDWIAEHGWTLILVGGATVATCVCAAVWRSRLGRSSLWPQLLVLLLLLSSSFLLLQRIEKTRNGLLFAARNFYGVIRVTSDEVSRGELRQLFHGTTTHGVQVNIPGLRSKPTAYYSPSSGIAVAVTMLTGGRDYGSGGAEGLHFGIVGMGIGTMSAFARAGDRVRYYEINPKVIDVAEGSQPYFTYVKESTAEVATVLGDARLSLERELAETGSQRFDLLVMDAFSGDSVPMHLITEEAFRVYTTHLKRDESILAVNVTNRYLDLEPVVTANAQELGFYAVRVDTKGDPPVVLESSWILLTRNLQVVTNSAIVSAGGRLLGGRVVRFTDKYSNLFRVLK